MSVKQCETAIEQALAANAVSAFRRAGGTFAYANRWMQTHVVHAMASCPDVLEYWLINAPQTTKAVQLYRYVASALEHLDDEAKVQLLQGQSRVPAHHNLYKYLKDPIPRHHWSALSPAWVGKTGSALRQAAMDLGWQPHMMHQMITDGMQHPGWERWLAHVPYAYSIVAAHWAMLQRISGKVRLPIANQEMPTLVCSNHANPSDVVVALEMLRLHGGDFAAGMRAPEKWEAPHPREVQRLQALVRWHWDLGMQDAFVEALREGTLLGDNIEAPLFIELPAAFDATKETKTTSWYSQRMHELLHSDNVVQWQREFPNPGRSLADWMLDNVLHAMEACPNVMEYWHAQTPKQHYHGVLHHCLAGALDGLDDATKIRVLRGEGRGSEQAQLAAFIESRQFDWRLFSPAWVGHPGSDLRAQAVHLGWTRDVLAGQVTWALRRPSASQWTLWVRYPHSLAVLHRHACAKKELYEKARLLEPTELHAMPWANGDDLALAQRLIEHSPIDLQFYLDQRQVQGPTTNREAHQQMDAVVRMHVGLGMWEELRQAVVQGELPGVGSQATATLELPELGLDARI